MAAKKMILVDPEQWRGATPSVPTPTPPLTDTLASSISSLDKEMKEILSSSELEDYQKAQLYQQALQRYLALAEKYRQRPLGKLEMIPQEKKEGPEINYVEDLKSTVINSVPKNLRPKAELLWRQMETIPEVKWDKMNQLVIGDRVYQGSNIVDLFHDLVRERKRSDPPKGWELLAKALKRANVPREVIGNSERWRWMQKFSKNEGEEKETEKGEEKVKIRPSRGIRKQKRVWQTLKEN